MTNTDLYEIMFKRKSIRKYDLSPMTEKEVAEIATHLSNLKPLYENIKTEFKIMSQQEVKSILPWKAPYYIVAFSEIKEGYLANIGFMLQQMDLLFSTNGIGSCWQGWPKPIKEILAESNLDFVIVMAFGKPQETLHKASVSEYKRKPLEQIRNMSWADELLEPVRLAPTTTQPWYFTGSEGIIHVYCAHPRSIMAKMNEKYRQIEIGIGICHLWIAAQHFDKGFKFINDIPENDKIPKDYRYIFSIKIYNN